VNTFPLKIVTPDGLIFDGDAREILVRTTGGDLAVLAGHVNYVASLGMGRTTLVDAEGSRRHAACIGGMLSVVSGRMNLIPTTFEWAEDIDAARAELSRQRAEKVLRSRDASETEIRLAEARHHRALVRKSVASHK
jgi:F-type H+-transporting ATPase subunit epsilon